jgi:hypothetical protein
MEPKDKVISTVEKSGGPQPTRRGVLARFASVPLAGSVIGAVSASALAAAESELEWLRIAVDAAQDESDRLFDQYTEMKPPRPDGLYASSWDLFHHFPYSQERRPADDSVAKVYGPEEIEIFRTPPRDGAFVAPTGLVWRPDGLSHRRADQIVALYDEWMAEDEALRDRLGLIAANSHLDECWDRYEACLRRIRETPATSMGDLQIKARILRKNNALSAEVEDFVAEIIAFSSHVG